MSHRQYLLTLLEDAGVTTWQLVRRLDRATLRSRLAAVTHDEELAEKIVDALRQAAGDQQGRITAYELPGQPIKGPKRDKKRKKEGASGD